MYVSYAGYTPGMDKVVLICLYAIVIVWYLGVGLFIFWLLRELITLWTDYVAEIVSRITRRKEDARRGR